MRNLPDSPQTPPPAPKTKITPERRAEINRANAQKSTGPVSPEGKARSRMNAFRHGLSGQFLVLHPDDASAFNENRRHHILAHRPVGPEEEHLVRLLADASWLLERANALELNSRAFASMPLCEHTPEEDQRYIDSRIASRQDPFIEPEIPVDILAVTCADYHHHLHPVRLKEKLLSAQGRSSLEWIGRHRYRIERSFFKLRSELKALQKERFFRTAQARMTAQKLGAAYDPEIHGPFNDDAFDPALSPSLANCSGEIPGSLFATDARGYFEKLDAAANPEQQPLKEIKVTWIDPYANDPDDSDDKNPRPGSGGGAPASGGSLGSGTGSSAPGGNAPKLPSPGSCLQTFPNPAPANKANLKIKNEPNSAPPALPLPPEPAPCYLENKGAQPHPAGPEPVQDLPVRPCRPHHLRQPQLRNPPRRAPGFHRRVRRRQEHSLTSARRPRSAHLRAHPL